MEVIATKPDVPGRIVIVDPDLVARLFPPACAECLARIDALEKATRRGGW